MISPEALSVAKQHLSGVPDNQLLAAMGNALQSAPNVPLMQLIAAHKMLTQEQQKQQAMQAMQMAQQGGGVAPQQPTTVAQDTEQGLAQLATQNQQPMQPSQQPMAQEPTMQAAHGGLMQLPVHNFRPESYAGGGIVAFGDPELNPNENQVVSTETGDKYTRFPSSTNERQLVYPSMLDRLFNRDAMKTYNDMVSRRKGQTTSKDLAAQNTGQSTTTPEALVAEPATINPETGTRYTPLSAVSPELVAEPVEQGLGSTPEAQTRRLATTPAATTAVTPAAAAAGTASASTPAIDAAIAQSAATRKRLADTLDESKETPLSRDQAQTRAEQENTDALKKAGVKSYKDRIDELKGQATQAREDRNTDRWLAVAQGFFAMGAGKSRYAMQNMAEGLGIGVSQLKDAEKEHRKAEQASKDRVALLEEGHRQETLGNVKAGRELFEKAQQREADRRKSDLATLGHLAGTDESGVTRLVTAHEAAETRKSISRDAALQRAATSADSMSLRKTISENAQTEAKRQHDLQDAATRRTLYARAVEKHPGYKTLQELSQSIADMQSRPDLTIEQQKNLQAKITQHNALQAAIHTAADAAAQREFGAGGGGFSNFRQGQ